LNFTVVSIFFFFFFAGHLFWILFRHRSFLPPPVSNHAISFSVCSLTVCMPFDFAPLGSTMSSTVFHGFGLSAHFLSHRTILLAAVNMSKHDGLCPSLFFCLCIWSKRSPSTSPAPITVAHLPYPLYCDVSTSGYRHRRWSRGNLFFVPLLTFLGTTFTSFSFSFYSGQRLGACEFWLSGRTRTC